MKFKYGINAIRGLAMLGVFFFHVEMLPGGGYLPTLFIVMAGFFSVYGYDKYQDQFFWEYALARLKRYYPVHCLCFVGGIYIAFSLYGAVLNKTFIKQCLLYSVLLQSLVPEFYSAINGVEWTLSVLVICYLFTPFIIQFLPYICKYKVNFVWIYLIQIVYILVVRNNEDYIWFCGVNPLFRILDYMQGCMLAYMIMNVKIKYSSRLELASFLTYVFVVFVIAPKIEDILGWSLLFTPLSLGLIKCFYSDCGVLCKNIFKLSIFQKLGDISFEFYMFHQIVLRFWSQYLINKKWWVSVSFSTTIVIVVLYRYLFGILRRKWNNCSLAKT